MRVKQLIALFLLLIAAAAVLNGYSKQDDLLEGVSFTLPDGVEQLEYREGTGVLAGGGARPLYRRRCGKAGGKGVRSEFLTIGPAHTAMFFLPARRMNGVIS